MRKVSWICLAIKALTSSPKRFNESFLRASQTEIIKKAKICTALLSGPINQMTQQMKFQMHRSLIEDARQHQFSLKTKFSS